MFLNILTRKSSSTPPPPTAVDLTRSWEFGGDSPPTKPTPKSAHAKLHGPERLLSLTHTLTVQCPWTQAVTSRAMLGYLRCELGEVRDEIGRTEKVLRNQASNPEIPAFQAKLDLQKELGDVLFDAFMLNAIVSRDHGLDASATFATVCAKMEGRTPYVATWGDGETVATTADEAAGVWRKVKGEEREKEGGEKEEEDKEVGSDTMPGKVTKQLKGTLGRVRSSVAATVTRNWNLLVEDRCVGVSTAVGVAVVGVVLGYLVARKGNGGSRNAAIAAAATAATLPSLPALPNLPEVFSNSNKTVNAGVAAFVDNVKAPFALVVKSVGKGVERLRGAKSE